MPKTPWSTSTDNLGSSPVSSLNPMSFNILCAEPALVAGSHAGNEKGLGRDCLRALPAPSVPPSYSGQVLPCQLSPSSSEQPCPLGYPRVTNHRYHLLCAQPSQLPSEPWHRPDPLVSLPSGVWKPRRGGVCVLYSLPNLEKHV